MADVVSLLSDLHLSTGKNDCWTGIRTANVPAVIAAAAAASGADLKVTDTVNLEVLPTAISSATLKCNYAGEIAGMRRLYNTIGGFQMGSSPAGIVHGVATGGTRAHTQSHIEKESFNEILLIKFVQLLQQFVSIAEKGGLVDKTQFREICSQATALLLSSIVSIFFFTRASVIRILLAFLCTEWCNCFRMKITSWT